MNETYRKAVTEKLTELACMLVEIAGLLNSTAAEEAETQIGTKTAEAPNTASPAAEPVETPAETPPTSEKVYTYEEVRATLAEKARTGFRAEIKGILTKHGVNQLSEVRDQATFAAIMAEAEEIKID